MSPTILPEPKTLSMLFFTVAVIVPSLIVFIMNGIEALVESMGRTRRSMKVGWDLCVLGLGAAGSIILDVKVLAFLGAGGVIVAASVSVVVSLGASVLIAHMRRMESPGSMQAIVALMLGAVALAVPAFLSLHR